MAMSWNTLTAAKGSAGAIATWVNYAKLTLDVGTILDEAQALLYTLLRCREMRTRWQFVMPVGSAYIALPTGFLDPIGKMYTPTLNLSFDHRDEAFLQQQRNYDETTGTLGTNPFTTTSGSNSVIVNLPNHGFNQDSVFFTTGATAFNGVTIAGTFPVTSIIDVNNFTIDITSLGATPTSSGAGGGTVINYTCDILEQGSPLFWAIFDESIYFDSAFDQQTTCQLYYFMSPTLLSASNPTNFLTNRYPMLLRQACLASAANWMKDNAQEQLEEQKLIAMVQSVAMENDMFYRGASIETETP